jgi:aspartyl-tRNA(Asn)/glutamyl-tRNA(Gln) amidotransferase subunit A
VTDIATAGRRLRAKEVSCLELVDESLRKIEAGSDLNAFITITAEQARSEARKLDAELAAGKDRGPLHGIPIAFKDLFYTKDVLTTNGSKLFADFVPGYSATVVERLAAAGAISVGKLNQHELAYGITSSNPHYGSVRNPHGRDHIPGGSSGGSGAAVAADMVYMAMGSDTGGSIRIPATFCGCVGLKPTFGRVSRYGCFPLGLTLDHMGPLTRTVRDSALILNVIAGSDPHEETASARPVDNCVPAEQPKIADLRFGWPDNFFNERLDSDVRKSVEKMAARVEESGGRLVRVKVPDVAALNVVARTILGAEASAVMAPHVHKRDHFGQDVLTLFDQGRQVTGADYVNAQRLRRVMLRDWVALFRTIDVLLTPTAPNPAPRIGQTTVTLEGQEEDTRLASTRFVRSINAIGYPALSIPCGATESGLPIGLQLVARPFEEALLCRAGAALEL